MKWRKLALKWLSLFSLWHIDVYLEAHEGDLSRGNVFTAFGHSDTRDIVGVSLQELLFAMFETLQNDSAPQWVNEVFLIRMHSQTRKHVSYWKK